MMDDYDIYCSQMNDEFEEEYDEEKKLEEKSMLERAIEWNRYIDSVSEKVDGEEEARKKQELFRKDKSWKPDECRDDVMDITKRMF